MWSLIAQAMASKSVWVITDRSSNETPESRAAMRSTPGMSGVSVAIATASNKSIGRRVSVVT